MNIFFTFKYNQNKFFDYFSIIEIKLLYMGKPILNKYIYTKLNIYKNNIYKII